MPSKLIIFFFIIVLGATLRLMYLSLIPPALNWDEVSHGYNAYSILKTGRDEWGEFFPITNFRAYGDYPLPLNLYLTIPFIKILGLNEFSIRLPHAILGILTIISTYFLAYGLTRKENLSFLAAFLVAIEPWHVFGSRFVVQSNLSVLLLTTAAAAFFNRERNKYLLPITFLFLGLTLFSYHSTRIFTPLFLLVLFLIFKNELIDKFKKEKLAIWFSVVLISIFFLPLPFILVNPEARARSQMVFLINEGATSQINQNRQSSSLPPVLSRLFYNKPVYFISEFSKNYLGYFQPQFLFFNGGTQYQFNVPNKGLLYPVNLPLFYLGLVIVLIYALRGKKDYQLIFAWLLLAPISASITQDKFAVIRSTTMLPLPQLLIAVGGFFALKWLEMNFRHLKFLASWLVIAYVAILSILTVSYLKTYFSFYRNNYSWSWQYGYKQAVEFIKENYVNYDKIIFTKRYGEPHEFILFYWPWEPQSYREDSMLVRFYQSNWYWVDRFDKFYFVNDWEIPKTEDGVWKMEHGDKIFFNSKTLLVTSPGNYPPGWRLLKTINFLDNKPAFEILEKV